MYKSILLTLKMLYDNFRYL